VVGLPPYGGNPTTPDSCFLYPMCDLTYGSSVIKVDSAACKIYVEVENVSCFIESWKLSLVQGSVLKSNLERYA
jgi:hypothetical protein